MIVIGKWITLAWFKIIDPYINGRYHTENVFESYYIYMKLGTKQNLRFGITEKKIKPNTKPKLYET